MIYNKIFKNLVIAIKLIISIIIIGQVYADEPFEFEQSVLQSAYFISNVLINNEQIDSDDWVGVYCGEQCVGGKQWDPSQCGNGVCDIIAMGNDGTGNTDGYCVSGDEVSFQIYDTSDDLYLDAIPSENQTWTINGFTFIENLEATSDGGDGNDITDGCDLPDSNTTSYLHLTEDGSVLYKSLDAIGGFQFNVDGATISSGSGGDMAANGLIGQASGNTFISFSFTGSSIPTGCGTLVNLSLNGEATGLSNIIISDATGVQIYFEYYDGDDDIVLGCSDISACNYDSDATEDDGSCTYAEENYDCDGECTANTDCEGICGGNAELDECGVCDGDGSSCADCAGVPNGDAEDLGCGCNEPAPGECGCNDLVDLGCGCGQAGPSGCDNECGSTAELDECGVCDGDGSSCGGDWDGDACSMPDLSVHITPNGTVLYNTSSGIAGFQFDVDGAGV